MRIENYREKGEREKREFRRVVGLVLVLITSGMYLALDNFPWPTGLIFFIGLCLYGKNIHEERTIHLATTFNAEEIFTEKILYEVLEKHEREKYKKVKS
jgi:hypothetical protein